jgi:hypothetical protein
VTDRGWSSGQNGLKSQQCMASDIFSNLTNGHYDGKYAYANFCVTFLLMVISNHLKKDDNDNSKMLKFMLRWVRTHDLSDRMPHAPLIEKFHISVRKRFARVY